MLIEILTYVLIASYVMFLIIGWTIFSRWRTRLASSPLDLDMDGSPTAGGTILVMKPSGIIVDKGWASVASFFAGGVLVLTIMAEEPDSFLIAAGYIAAVAALVSLPWIGLILTLGYCFILTDEDITRASPMSHERSIKWKQVKTLEYDEIIRGGFVLSDGVNSFTIDVMTKNGRRFFEYAKDRIPAQAWDKSAVDEMGARLKASHEAGAHMITSSKKRWL